MMRSLSVFRRGVTRLQHAATSSKLAAPTAAPSGSRALSSRAACTGVDVIDPTIGLNEDQKVFYDLARSFADEQLAPFAAQWDEDCHFPLDVLKKVGQLGFGGINIREDVGGSGLSRVDGSVIYEALSTGCVGTTAMLTIHNM
jgi:isobutyryl-CoA dehydrogenase